MWSAYLTDHGAAVVAIAEPDLDGIRVELGVPEEAAACHSALVDGYVVQGHAPVEAIARLLADHPDAVGIAVPGMPVGSPGMGGDPQTWSEQEVLLMGPDGVLTPFDF